MVAKGFEDAATRWSAFEREYFAFKEGYDAIAKWVSGFTVFMFFDHKNIENAESVLASRRASKKLINWIANTQHLLANTVRIWIDGKLNVLADAGSRAPWEDVVAKHLPVPATPIWDTIIKMFGDPKGLGQDIAKRARDMDLKPWREVPQSKLPEVERGPLRYVEVDESFAPEADAPRNSSRSKKSTGVNPRSSKSSSSHQSSSNPYELDSSVPGDCLLYTSPSPRDRTRSRMPSSA